MHLSFHHNIKILTLTACLFNFLPHSRAFLPLRHYATRSGGCTNINIYTRANRFTSTHIKKNKSIIISSISQNESDTNNNNNPDIKHVQKNHQQTPTEMKIPKSPNQMPLLLPITNCNPTQMSPTSLAYIGDVVYEMCIRCRYVWPSRRTSDLQNVVVAKVRGKIDFKLDFCFFQCFQCWVFTPVWFRYN